MACRVRPMRVGSSASCRCFARSSDGSSYAGRSPGASRSQTVRAQWLWWLMVFFFQAEDGIRDDLVTGVQTCALDLDLCIVIIPGKGGPGIQSHAGVNRCSVLFEIEVVPPQGEFVDRAEGFAFATHDVVKGDEIKGGARRRGGGRGRRGEGRRPPGGSPPRVSTPGQVETPPRGGDLHGR